jgi:hypothetical protein
VQRIPTSRSRYKIPTTHPRFKKIPTPHSRYKRIPKTHSRYKEIPTSHSRYNGIPTSHSIGTIQNCSNKRAGPVQRGDNYVNTKDTNNSL